MPYPNAKKRVASQRWHRDPDDDHIVKMFIYLSDVAEEAGPFEYVRDSAAGGRYGDLFRGGTVTSTRRVRSSKPRSTPRTG